MKKKEDISLELKELVFYNQLTCLSIYLDIRNHSFSMETNLEIFAHELVCLTTLSNLQIIKVILIF